MQQPMLRRMGLAPRRQCFMKATQGGVSEKEVSVSLHGMIHGHYPRGVLYLFPTTDDVREFSKSRFGPLIAANPSTIGQFVKDTDTASLKRVGDSFLFLRGARLSQHIDSDAQESAKLRSISVDKVIFDEFDLMDTEVAGKAQGRLGASEVKEEVYISNPTLPDFGISTLFSQSDQRHWFRQCGHCGIEPPAGADWEWFLTKKHGWTSAEVAFPDLIAQDGNGKGYVACSGCGKATGLGAGKWVAREPSKSKYMWGYRWSQLSSATNDPYEILEQYTNPPDGNLADVVRLRLGLPYVAAEDKLTAGQVLSCCGSNPQLNGHPGPCAIGIDVRRHKNVVIGCRTGKDRYRILRVARLDKLEDVLQMANRFNVRFCVGDIRPYEDEMRQFQRTAKFKTYLCEYSDSTPVGTTWNEQTGLVKVNRTEVMDASHRLIVSERQLELPGRCPEIDQFAQECSSLAKIQEIDKRTKQVKFRYRKVGSDSLPDDYRHALNYFYLAASSNHLPIVGDTGARQRPQHAKNEYVRC